MGWMEELLGTVPAAAKYRAELETLVRENARLRSENAELKNELRSTSSSGKPSTATQFAHCNIWHKAPMPAPTRSRARTT